MPFCLDRQQKCHNNLKIYSQHDKLIKRSHGEQQTEQGDKSVLEKDYLRSQTLTFQQIRPTVAQIQFAGGNFATSETIATRIINDEDNRQLFTAGKIRSCFEA